MNKGKIYEDFIEKIYKAILEAEKKAGAVKQIKLDRNITLPGKSGATAEIDILWEYVIADINFRVAIECKNYGRPLDIGKIRDFSAKIRDAGLSKGIIVSQNGFTKKAKKFADSESIDLIVIREQNSKDWDGYLSAVQVNLIAMMPARTIKIEPKINREWFLKNGYKVGDSFSFSEENDKIFIEEPAANFRYSLFELEENNFFEARSAGTHVWKKDLSTPGWLIIGDVQAQLDSIEITYHVPENIKSEFSVDLTKHVLAIMEYIKTENEKYVLLDDGTKKPF